MREPKKETTYGLSPIRLARLLSLGLERTNAHRRVAAGRQPAQVLQEMLTTKLPIDPAVPDSVPAVLNRPCGELLPAAGRSMGDVLLDPTTD